MLNICMKLKSKISFSCILMFIYLDFKAQLPGLVNFRGGENKIYSDHHLECLSLLQHRIQGQLSTSALHLFLHNGL